MKKKFYLSRNDKKLAGLCGGVAEYFDIDSTLVRFGFIISIFLSSGFAILVYIVMAVVSSTEPPTAEKKTSPKKDEEPFETLR